MREARKRWTEAPCQAGKASIRAMGTRFSPRGARGGGTGRILAWLPVTLKHGPEPRPLVWSRGPHVQV